MRRCVSTEKLWPGASSPALAANAALAEIPATTVTARSRLYRSAPWGVTAQPEFVNAVAGLETQLGPCALLQALLAIERAAGRERGGERWGPRVLDLDLLVHGETALDEAGLHLPHPHLHERAFVLMPLAEIAPGLDIPGRGRVAERLARADARGCTPLD